MTTIRKTDREWRKSLTRQQYRVARKGATERAFTGQYWDHNADGTYLCVCCGLDLFDSAAKFDSGTGWPSFVRPASGENVGEREDRSFFMRRTEVVCARCDAHLGHVFPDGPGPEGTRYCINSAALDFAGRGGHGDADQASAGEPQGSADESQLATGGAQREAVSR